MLTLPLTNNRSPAAMTASVVLAMLILVAEVQVTRLTAVIADPHVRRPS